MIDFKEIHNSGYIDVKVLEGKDVYHISTPCIFRIGSDIVKSLKQNYSVTEEIGGVLWATPILNNIEKVFVIDNVSYIRNAIEDKPRKDGRNKSNAYCFDDIQLKKTESLVYAAKSLPLRFHSHPTAGEEMVDEIINMQMQTDTSDQDKRESESIFKVNGHDILLPRCLIVGDSLKSSDIFIGIYGGFIAPKGFDVSKKKVIEENFQKTIDKFKTIELTTEQKICFGIGASLLLFAAVKYPKYSIPVIIGLAFVAPVLLSNTQTIDRPQYFNRLAYGSAEIYLPECK